MQKRKKFTHWLAYIIPVILVIGVVAGAGIWLLNVEVPIEYDQPYTIYMSEREIDEEDEDEYEWRQLPFKDTTTTERADFSDTGWNQQYHQYVRIDNPDGGTISNVVAEIEAPEGFEDGDMGFTVLDGIVEPGETDGIVDEYDSTTHNEIVDAGETVEFTVIYTLDDAPEDDGTHDVIWDFYEGDGITNENTGEEYATIQAAINDAGDEETILVGPGTYDGFTVDVKGLTIESVEEHAATIEGRIRLSEDDVTISGLHVSTSTESMEGADRPAAIFTSNTGTVIENNLISGIDADVRDIVGNSMKGIHVWSQDAIENIELRNNIVEDLNLEGVDGDWGDYGNLYGIYVQGEINGATVEDNTIQDLWSAGYTMGLSAGHTNGHTPDNVEVRNNHFENLETGDAGDETIPAAGFEIASSDGDPDGVTVVEDNHFVVGEADTMVYLVDSSEEYEDLTDWQSDILDVNTFDPDAIIVQYAIVPEE